MAVSQSPHLSGSRFLLYFSNRNCINSSFTVWPQSKRKSPLKGHALKAGREVEAVLVNPVLTKASPDNESPEGRPCLLSQSLHLFPTLASSAQFVKSMHHLCLPFSPACRLSSVFNSAYLKHMRLLKRKTFESLVQVGDPHWGNAEKRTLLRKPEAKLSVPEGQSPKSALFLLKSNIGRCEIPVGTWPRSVRDSQGEWTCHFRLRLWTAGTHFPHHQARRPPRGQGA